MSEASFLIAYDGPGVADGRMGVRQLAPALLAIGKLIEDGNRTLNEDAAQVSVRIRPSTRQGSALVDLEMQFGLSEQVSALVGGGGVTDAHQLLALLGFLDPQGRVVGNIISVIDWLKTLANGRIVSSTTLEDGSSSVEVEHNNGEINNYNVNESVFLLANKDNIRKHLRDAVGPAATPLVDEFQVRDPEDEERIIDRVGKEDVKHFGPPRKPDIPEEEIQEGEFTEWVTVRKSWVVQPDRKWQFAHPNGVPFNAVVEDEDFWNRIEQDEVKITRHGKFHVRVKWRQEGDDAEPEHTVVEVLDQAGPDATQDGLGLDGE